MRLQQVLPKYDSEDIDLCITKKSKHVDLSLQKPLQLLDKYKLLQISDFDHVQMITGFGTKFPDIFFVDYP